MVQNLLWYIFFQTKFIFSWVPNRSKFETDGDLDEDYSRHYVWLKNNEKWRRR